MAHNARYARLAIEYTKLMNLAARSNFIDICPVEVQPGWPPEKYVITYRCRGIAALDQNQMPRASDFHQVSMYMGSEYPLKEPYLKWLTPIWHPNIDHKEPHHVCTNNVQNWFAAKPLAELILAMGEMVQYKHYHAKWVSPFPLDRAAADWVLDIAEPRGIVGPNKPFDDRPLLVAQRMRTRATRSGLATSNQAKKQIRLGRAPVVVRPLGQHVARDSSDKQVGAVPLRSREFKPRGVIRFGKPTEDGRTSSLQPASGDTRRPLENPLRRGNGKSTPTQYFIEIHRNGQLQRIEQIEKPLVSIGRGALDKSVDLILEGDQTMSRLHVILERDESGAFWLTVKGQNPVTVRGRMVPRDRSIAIDVGDLIQICSYSITIK